MNFKDYFDSICSNIFENDKTKILAQFPDIKRVDVWQGMFIVLEDEAFHNWTVPKFQCVKQVCLLFAKKYDTQNIIDACNFRVSFDNISNYEKYGSSGYYWRSDLIANQITV